MISRLQVPRQPQRASNDGWIGSLTLPKLMTQHDGPRGTRRVVLLGKAATDHRLHTQEGKEPGRHLHIPH